MLGLNLAQWTAIAITVIVVLGSDIDMFYAVPIGFLAGALAAFFSALANGRITLSALRRLTLTAFFRRRRSE